MQHYSIWIPNPDNYLRPLTTQQENGNNHHSLNVVLAKRRSSGSYKGYNYMQLSSNFNRETKLKRILELHFYGSYNTLEGSLAVLRSLFERRR